MRDDEPTRPYPNVGTKEFEEWAKGELEALNQACREHAEYMADMQKVFEQIERGEI